jgi:hypothetical protein
MPLGFVARLRCRRAAVVLAAALIAVQAFFAGLAMAEAALVLTPDLTEIAVICHGDGGADPGNGAAPNPIKARHLCCLSCTAGAPPVTLPGASIVPRSDHGRTLKSPAYLAATLLVAPRAVRAGLSQAPPSRA